MRVADQRWHLQYVFAKILEVNAVVGDRRVDGQFLHFFLRTIVHYAACSLVVDQVLDLRTSIALSTSAQKKL